MATLEQTLTFIAGQVKADAQELIRYANEDAIGGYHINEALRLWPMGSMYGVEGQIIYALIRFFKPETIAEIGGWAGCSATHMALAVKANGKGHIISVDNGVGGMAHGYLIPEEYRQYVTLVNEDGRVWLSHLTPNSVDFLFEDADHSTSLVRELGRLAMTKVVAGGLYLAHDAAHDFAYVGGNEPGTYNKVNSTVGQAVRQGLAEAGLSFTPYLAEPSDCGLAIAVMPGVKELPHVFSISERRRAEMELSEDHLAAISQVLSEPKASEESINNSAEKAQIGIAPVESMSEPPEPKATEDNPIVRAEVKPVEKKPRGKGRKKAE